MSAQLLYLVKISTSWKPSLAAGRVWCVNSRGFRDRYLS